MKLRDHGLIGSAEEAELWEESRSDSSLSVASSEAAAMPNSEVVAKASRRRFTAAYKLKILEQVDACTDPGGVGRILRREGLYSSLLTSWRQARREGALESLDRKRGRRAKQRNPLEKKVVLLEREIERLRGALKKAETILEVQGKVAGLLGFSLIDGKDC